MPLQVHCLLDKNNGFHVVMYVVNYAIMPLHVHCLFYITLSLSKHYYSL